MEDAKPAPTTNMIVNENLDVRDLRYFKFVFSRTQGWSDEKIIKELNDPDTDSSQVLFRRLKNDGHSIGPDCGTTYVEEGHCESSSLQRRARGSEVEERELPAVSDKVAEAFKDVISDLSSALDTLPFVKQWLKDGRFTTEVVYTK